MFPFNILRSDHYGSINHSNAMKNNYDNGWTSISNKSKILNICAILFCLIFCNAPRGIFFSFTNIVSRVHDINNSWKHLNEVSGMGKILFAIVAGHIAARYGYWRTIFWINVATFSAIAVHFLIPSISGIYFIQVLLGVCACSIPIIRSIVIENQPLSLRPKLSAYLLAIQYVGFFSMPIIGAQLISSATINSSLNLSILQIMNIPFIILLLFTFTMILLSGLYKDSPINKPNANMNILSSYIDYDAVRTNNGNNGNISSSINPKDNSNSNVFLLSTSTSEYKYELSATCVSILLLKLSTGLQEMLIAQFCVTYSIFFPTHIRIGYIFSVLAVTGVVTMLSVHWLNKFMKNAQILTMGIFSILLSNALILILMITNLYEYSSDISAMIIVFSIFLTHTIGFPFCYCALNSKISCMIENGPQIFEQSCFFTAESISSMILSLCVGMGFGDTTNVTAAGFMTVQSMLVLISLGISLLLLKH